MYPAKIRVRRFLSGLAALLLVVAGEAAAQVYHPAELDQVEQAPLLVLRHAPDAMRVLEPDMDLRALNSGYGNKRPAAAVNVERLQRWTLYGRYGLLNFRNELDPQSTGVQFTWRRTGPGSSGKKIFIGISRNF